MKSIFSVGMIAVAVGIGCAVVAGSAQAQDPALRYEVCTNKYGFNDTVSYNGHNYLVESITSEGRQYNMRDLSTQREFPIICG